MEPLHNQLINRADLTQALKTLILALGDRSQPTMKGCFNISYENFFKLLQTTIQTAQEVAKPSANYFSFSKTGNCLNLSDNTKELRTISKTGIQGGTIYILDVKQGQKILHMFTGPMSTTHARIRVHTQQDWTAGRDTSIILWYDSENDLWKICGDTLSDVLADLTNIIALRVQANGYDVTALTANITGWLTDELTGFTVTNEGTSAVSISANTSVEFTAGTLFGIKIYNSSNDLIHELVCCECNANVPYLHCAVTGRVFFITTTKTVIKQDVYFRAQQNGMQIYTDSETNEVFYVPYKNDKTKIYE